MKSHISLELTGISDDNTIRFNILYTILNLNAQRMDIIIEKIPNSM